MAKTKKESTALVGYDQCLPTTDDVKNAKAGAFTRDTTKLKKGESAIIRLLLRSHLKGDDGQPLANIIGAKRHFCRVNTDTLIVGICSGANCYVEKKVLPALEKSNNPLDRAKLEKNGLGSWLAKGWFLCNAIFRNEEHLGPQTFELQMKFVTEFLNGKLAKSGRDGNPFDPLGARDGNPGGYDIEIECVESNGFATYQGTVSPVFYRPLSADPVRLKDWLDNQPSLEALVKPTPWEEWEQKFQAAGNPTGWTPPTGGGGYGERRVEQVDARTEREPGDDDDDEGMG